MAVNPLSLAESLRPWRHAGVFALLSEEGAGNALFADISDRYACFTPDPDALACAGDTETAAPGTAGETSMASAPPSAVPERPAASGFARKAAEPSAEETHTASRPSPVPAAFAGEGRSAGTGRDEKRQTAPDRTPADGLPEPWREILSRTVPAPIIWTYAELGDDLAGRGDQKRSACLRYIIGSLHLPKGSSAFWPVCLSRTAPAAPSSAAPGPAETNGHADEKRFFLSGLRALRPRVVILLGARTIELSGLAVPLSTPFTQKIHMGTLYVLLPDFHALLGRTVLKEQACVFLRSALSGLTLG